MKLQIKDTRSLHVPFDKLVKRLHSLKSSSIEKNKISRSMIDIDFVYRYSTLNHPKVFNAVITPFPMETTSSLMVMRVLPLYLYGVPILLGAFLTFLVWNDFFDLKAGLIIWIVFTLGYYLYIMMKFQDNRDQLLTDLTEA